MERKVARDRRLDVDYARYRRLLTAALARLARAGYVAPPDEGLDLIHDFIVLAWDELERRFDPGKASYETYVFAAFVRFARTRIVRLNRLRDGLIEPGALAALDIKDAGREDRAADADALAVRRAADFLEPSERALLFAYVDDDGPSERTLARDLGITRYDLRLRLAEALGRLAIGLGETGALEARVGAVAEALWRDNRSVREAADILRVSTAEVQDARGGLFRRLSRAVKGERAMGEIKGGGRPVETHGVNARALLDAALRPEATAVDFAALRSHADDVWAFLDGPTADAVLSEAGDLDARHVGEIYAALAGGDLGIDDDPVYNALVEISLRDEGRIGEAFEEVLLPNLRDDLTRFRDDVFHDVPPVDPQHRVLLLGDPSVMAGGRGAAELADFGLTPSLVMEAARSVSGLALRTCRANAVKRGGELIVERAGDEVTRCGLPVVVTRQACIEEIQLTTRLSLATASRLHDWLCQVVGYAPCLFDGFEARPSGDELRLLRTDVDSGDVSRRFGSSRGSMAA